MTRKRPHAAIGQIDLIQPERERTFFDLFDSSVAFRMAVGLAMIAIAFLVIAYGLTGCAAAKPKPVLEQVVYQAPKMVEAVTKAAVTRPKGEPSSYTVAKGDSLWKITAKGGNPFLWPLIWKANRDQVIDPDWIEPGLELSIPYSAPAQDVMWATDLAEHRSAKPQKKVGW